MDEMIRFEEVEKRVLTVRGQHVLLDRGVAELYECVKLRPTFISVQGYKCKGLRFTFIIKFVNMNKTVNNAYLFCRRRYK